MLITNLLEVSKDGIELVWFELMAQVLGLKSEVVVEAIGGRKVSIDQMLHRQETDPTADLRQPQMADSAGFSGEQRAFRRAGWGWWHTRRVPSAASQGWHLRARLAELHPTSVGRKMYKL